MEKTLVRRYFQGYHFIEVADDDLREECYNDMRECMPDGTPEAVLLRMGEQLFKICTSPHV